MEYQGFKSQALDFNIYSDGAPGANGVSVVSVTQEYALAPADPLGGPLNSIKEGEGENEVTIWEIKWLESPPPYADYPTRADSSTEITSEGKNVYWERQVTKYSDNHTEEGVATESTMLDVDFINALGITAKKITVIDKNKNLVFEADSYKPEDGVKIANFTVKNDKLYSGDHETISSTDPGIYLGSEGLSVGNGFKVSSGGVPTVAGYTKSVEKKYCIVEFDVVPPTLPDSVSGWWEDWDSDKWTITPPNRENGKYIWEWTKTTRTKNDSSDETKNIKVCITGAKGNPGESIQGRSVLSVTKFYKLAASVPDKPTVKNPTDWSVSPPAFSDGNNYYESDRTIYDSADSDGNDFSWSDVIENSMLTVDFINSLGITAKKITVLQDNSENKSDDNRIIFEADGSNPEGVVKIGGFEVDANKLYAGKEDNKVIINSNVTLDDIPATAGGSVGVYRWEGYTYILLDYIESTGKEYIDLGIQAKTIQNATVNFMYTGIVFNNNVYDAVYGTDAGLQIAREETGEFTNGIEVADDIMLNIGTRYVCEATYDYNDLSAGGVGKGTSKLRLHGETEYIGELSRSLSSITIDSNVNNIYLFSAFDNDVPGAAYFSKARIYNCNINGLKDNVSYKCELIPVLQVDTSTPGLYDTSTNTFYTNNSGKGGLIAGPIADMVPVELISIALGAEELSEAPFRVTNTGKLFASMGTIGGFTITPDMLVVNSAGLSAGEEESYTSLYSEDQVAVRFFAGASDLKSKTVTLQSDSSLNTVSTSISLSSVDVNAGKIMKAGSSNTFSEKVLDNSFSQSQDVRFSGTATLNGYTIQSMWVQFKQYISGTVSNMRIQIYNPRTGDLIGDSKDNSLLLKCTSISTTGFILSGAIPKAQWDSQFTYPVPPTKLEYIKLSIQCSYDSTYTIKPNVTFTESEITVSITPKLPNRSYPIKVDYWIKYNDVSRYNFKVLGDGSLYATRASIKSGLYLGSGSELTLDSGSKLSLRGGSTAIYNSGNLQTNSIQFNTRGERIEDNKQYVIWSMDVSSKKSSKVENKWYSLVYAQLGFYPLVGWLSYANTSTTNSTISTDGAGGKLDNDPSVTTDGENVYYWIDSDVEGDNIRKTLTIIGYILENQEN